MLGHNRPIMAIDSLIYARWVVPVEPTETIYQDYALAIDGGRIKDLLPAHQAEERYSELPSVRLDHHAVVPGLVNAHTHAAMVLLRGYADDLPLRNWLEEHIWPAERRWVNPQFVYDGARHAIAEMLLGGTTCFSDMYFHPDETARAAVEAGMRAAVGLIVFNQETPWAKDVEEYLRKGTAVHDALRAEPLLRTCFAPHAPYTVDDATLQHVAVLAEELDIPIHTHVNETADEVASAVKANKETPLQRLERLGLLTPRLIAVHMTQVKPEEVKRLARFGVSVVHCPESNLKLASGFCPVDLLLRNRVNVCLGTDGAASNNDLDMFGEMRSAALLAKATAGNPAAVPAHQVLRMATLNGARALGMDDSIGSLVAGKQADLVAVDMSGILAEPNYDPISQLVYATGRRQVTDVWVAGRRVVEDGRLTTLDDQAILAQTREWEGRLYAGS
jgi:5-methylthioadenosine/S-adenosylhomocysteine deaminase